MALTSTPPINLSDIQTETGTSSLHAAGGVAGVTAGGTAMTEFFGWANWPDELDIYNTTDGWTGVLPDTWQVGWSGNKQNFTVITGSRSYQTVNPKGLVLNIETDVGQSSSVIGAIHTNWEDATSKSILTDIFQEYTKLYADVGFASITELSGSVNTYGCGYAIGYTDGIGPPSTYIDTARHLEISGTTSKQLMLDTSTSNSWWDPNSPMAYGGNTSYFWRGVGAVCNPGVYDHAKVHVRFTRIYFAK